MGVATMTESAIKTETLQFTAEYQIRYETPGGRVAAIETILRSMPPNAVAAGAFGLNCVERLSTKIDEWIPADQPPSVDQDGDCDWQDSEPVLCTDGSDQFIARYRVYSDDWGPRPAWILAGRSSYCLDGVVEWRPLPKLP